MLRYRHKEGQTSRPDFSSYNRQRKLIRSVFWKGCDPNVPFKSHRVHSRSFIKISGFEPQQYSHESLDALMSAINKSKTDLEEEEDNELFKEDAELLQSALDSLEESLLEEFKQKKEDARAQYITSGRYTSSSTQLMQQVIDEADALAASPDATNAQMRDMMSKIDETSKKMVLLDNTTLKNAVFYLSDGLFARDSLTDKSQKDAETLKAEGLELSQTQSGENDAALKFYDKVKNALIGLEYKDGYWSVWSFNN